MAAVRREDLVRFARRDWAAIEEAKTQHWLRRRATMSSVEMWQFGYELWRHGRAVAPDQPSLADRLADLDVHQRVGRSLRAVVHTTRWSASGARR